MDELIKSVVSLNNIVDDQTKNGGNKSAAEDKTKSSKTKRCYFAGGTRYVVLALSTLCLSFVLANALVCFLNT